MKLKLILLTFITATLTAQKTNFNVRYSEPLAVYMFVKKLGANCGDNSFKTIYQKSIYNTNKYNVLIASLDTLRIDYTYKFTEFPYGSKIPGMTEAILKKNMIAATNLTDFKLRSVGLIPNTTLLQLTQILNEFTPVYHELVYQPNQSKFENQLAKLKDYINTNHTSRFFETGLTFYNAAWDNSIPFEIAFYPLPDSKGFTAEAFYNNAVSAIQTDLNNYSVLLSVMMHEIYHILFDEQALGFKNQLDMYFKQNQSRCSTYANLLLNEVLATALGNGYVYEQLNGKADDGEWYNWPYINQMAKQIYPAVKDYIKHKKSIDQAFVNTYIDLYEKNYLAWINEPAHLMTYRYVLSGKAADFDVFDRLYPYCSLYESEDAVSESSIKNMKNTPLTKLIIVSEHHKDQLTLIKHAFPELKKWKFNASKEFTHTVFLNDRTQLFIINQHQTATEVLVKELKTQAK